MIKYLHLTFITLAITGFIARAILSELNPDILRRKWLKIAPHIIDTLLLISGITLVFQGNWLAADYRWIVAKIVGLIGYIAFGIVFMRTRHKTRWLAFIGVLACFAYIAAVAVSKQAFFF